MIFGVGLFTGSSYPRVYLYPTRIGPAGTGLHGSQVGEMGSKRPKTRGFARVYGYFTRGYAIFAGTGVAFDADLPAGLYPRVRVWTRTRRGCGVTGCGCGDLGGTRGITREERYPRAYGTATKRNISYASDYFEAEEQWKNLQKRADKDGLVSFTRCFNFCKSVALPQVGPLSAMLMAGDLAYAGVIAMPSPAEMAGVIREVNKGAITALESLHILPGISPHANKVSKRSINSVVAAFTKVYDYFDERLSDEVKEQVKWGPIVLEHTLCKYGRVYPSVSKY